MQYFIRAVAVFAVALLCWVCVLLYPCLQRMGRNQRDFMEARSSDVPSPHFEMHFIMVATGTSIGCTRSLGMIKIAPAMGVGTEGMKTVLCPFS